MTTRTVLYETTRRLECGCVYGAPVVICVPQSITPADDNGYHPRTIEATLQSEQYLQNCQFGYFYKYTLSYDDTQLSSPPLTPIQIRGVFCKSCINDWILDQIALGGGGGTTTSSYTPLYTACGSAPSCEVPGEESPLYSYDIPANTFNTCGIRIKFSAAGNFGINGGTDITQTINFYIDGDLVGSCQITGTADEASSTGYWEIEGELYTTGSSESNPTLSCMEGKLKGTLIQGYGDIPLTVTNLPASILYFPVPNVLVTADTHTLLIAGTCTESGDRLNFPTGQFFTVDKIGVPVECTECDCE